MSRNTKRCINLNKVQVRLDSPTGPTELWMSEWVRLLAKSWRRSFVLSTSMSNEFWNESRYKSEHRTLRFGQFWGDLLWCPFICVRDANLVSFLFLSASQIKWMEMIVKCFCRLLSSAVWCAVCAHIDCLLSNQLSTFCFVDLLIGPRRLSVGRSVDLLVCWPLLACRCFFAVK